MHWTTMVVILVMIVLTTLITLVGVFAHGIGAKITSMGAALRHTPVKISSNRMAWIADAGMR